MTDWEAVFEDPKSGLVALALQAGTVESLKQCSAVIIQKLFARKDDAAERLRYAKLLDSIVDNDDMAPDLDAKKSFVSRLLRGIKSVRQEEAAEYLERKRRGAALERRNRKKLIQKRIRIAGYTLLGIALSIMLYIFTVWIIGEIKKSMNTKGPSVVQGAIDEKADGFKIPTGDDVARPVDTIIFNPVKWAFAPEGKKKRTIYYSPVFKLSNPEHFPEICRYTPSLLDKVYNAMSNTLPYSETPGDEELADAGEYATHSINQSLGFDAVASISLRSDIPDRLRQNNRATCRPYIDGPP